jgi:hypothetical protein
MAHPDFEEAGSAIIGYFESVAGSAGAKLAGFSGYIAAPGCADDIPARAHAEDDEGAARAGADGSGGGLGTGEGDESDLRAGERIAGFLVEDDSFDNCGVRAECQKKK